MEIPEESNILECNNQDLPRGLLTFFKHILNWLAWWVPMELTVDGGPLAAVNFQLGSDLCDADLHLQVLPQEHRKLSEPSLQTEVWRLYGHPGPSVIHFRSLLPLVLLPPSRHHAINCLWEPNARSSHGHYLHCPVHSHWSWDAITVAEEVAKVARNLQRAHYVHLVPHNVRVQWLCALAPQTIRNGQFPDRFGLFRHVHQLSLFECPALATLFPTH